MSALAAPFLMRRGSMSYVRVRVPNDLVELVGCSEVRRSLGPLRFHEARLLAARTGSKLKEAFKMMRNANDLTKQEVLNLIRDCFAGLSETYGQGYQPQSTDIDFELAEQRAMADEHMSALIPQVETRSTAMFRWAHAQGYGRTAKGPTPNLRQATGRTTQGAARLKSRQPNPRRNLRSDDGRMEL
jgi:hypothetical protein